MEELLSIADRYPRRSLEPGEVLLVDGEPVHALYVLLDGRLRIEKGGDADRDRHRTRCVRRRDVVAARRPGDRRRRRRANRRCSRSSRTRTRCSRARPACRSRSPGCSPRACSVMTTYLADIKQQYADHEGGLGMVDVVLGSLMRSSGTRSAARARNAIPTPSTSDLRTAANDRSSTPSSDDHRAMPGLGVELDARRDRAALAARVQDRASSRCGRSSRRPARTATGARARTARRRAGAARSTRRAPRRRSAACPVQLVGDSSGGAWYTQIHRRSPTSAASSASWRSTTSHVRGPSHHGHTVTITSSVSRRVPSTKTPDVARRVEPQRRALAELVARVEVVVARARDDGGLRRHAREVLEHDRDLRVGLDDRRDVEVVAGHDDEVEVGRDRRDPVELLQRVVQIGHEQDPHAGGS